MANDGTGGKFSGGDDRFALEHVQDLASFMADLEESKKGLGKSVFTAALKKAFKPVLNQAKKTSPVRTGALRKSVIVKSAGSRSRRTYGVEKNETAIQLGPFAKLDEYTSKKTGNTKKVYFRNYAKAVYFHSFALLRTPYRPFIADAVDAGGEQAMASAAGMVFEVWEARLRRQQKKIQAN